MPGLERAYNSCPCFSKPNHNDIVFFSLTPISQMVIILRLLLLLISLPLSAGYSPNLWYYQDSETGVKINVELFLSSTCPHCQKTAAFFERNSVVYPWLQIKANYINQDKEALAWFSQYLAMLNANDFSVPSVFFCGSRWVGYNSDETTGIDLVKALSYCKQQIEQQGTLSSATISTLQRWANANFFNAGIPEKPTTTHYFIATLLLDILGSCALFSMAGFLAILFTQQTKAHQCIAGFLFIIAVGIAHYVEQAYVSQFFHLLPVIRILSILIGLIGLYWVFCYYKDRLIRSSAVFIWVFLWAFCVYSYQQLCLMNWSYMFEQWLSNQSWSNGYKGLIQALYQFLYMMPSIIFLLIFLLIQKTSFFASSKNKLKTIGTLYIFSISLCLTLYPDLLTNQILSWAVLLGMAVLGWFFNKFNKVLESSENN
jgi:glutaredoxin